VVRFKGFTLSPKAPPAIPNSYEIVGFTLHPPARFHNTRIRSSPRRAMPEAASRRFSPLPFRFPHGHRTVTGFYLLATLNPPFRVDNPTERYWRIRCEKARDEGPHATLAATEGRTPAG
jgi:hypothetical protein